MEANKTTVTSHGHDVGDAHQRQVDFESVLSEGLVKIQQGALRSKARGQDFPCENSRHDISNFSAKYTKESWGFPQTYRNTCHGLDEQTMDFLQGILSRTELKEDDAGIYTLGLKALAAMSPHADTDDIEQENFQSDVDARKNFHLPKSRSDYSDVKRAVAVSSQVTLTNKSKERERVQSDQSLCYKGTQLDFFEALKEKLQLKDLENQQIVRLLLIKHQELIDIREIAKLREVETQVMAERLKCEEQRNFKITKKFNHVFEDMREKLSMAKSNNEHFVRQLRALLEKYERLKKRADAIKKRLLEECTKRKSTQKALKKTQQIAEELLMNQALLEEQRDAAKREHSEFRKKMKTIEEEQNKCVWTIQRFEEERSSMRADFVNLKSQLCNTQGENQKLTQALQSKGLEMGRAEKKVQQSQKLVKQLYEELDVSKRQREMIEEELNTMKKELKLIQNRYKVETLQLQEQQKSCMAQLEAKRIEYEALNEVVSNLKEDKNMLKEELQCLQKEKAMSETASKREVERMREAVSLLEHERKLLLDEMGDLRKDYVGLSDRITQRLVQLAQTDIPMFITDISSDRQTGTSRAENTAGQITSNIDMIEHIRRKLEEEENIQQK